MAEELVRLRRADEQRRFAASQRRGRIDPNPHQIDAVVFALIRIPEGGCILADEVGLGKTIEAGLIISQVLAEGRRRVLLIVPKALLGQWQTELYSLFGITVREGRADPEAFAGDGVFVVHREFAGGLKGAPLLSSADPFDLAVIDEAHEFFAGIYKRFDEDGNYKRDSRDAQVADRVRSLLRSQGTPVLLLTATPIQNSLLEIWGLVQYIEPTDQLLGRLPTFREVFCGDSDRTLDDDKAFELRRRLDNVMQRTLRRQAQEFLEIPFVEREARLIEYTMSPAERQLYEDVATWLMDPYLCAFGGRNRRLLQIGFHRRMGSSLAALRASLEKVADRLRKQLEDYATTHGTERDWEYLVQDLAHEFELDPEEEEAVARALLAGGDPGLDADGNDSGIEEGESSTAAAGSGPPGVERIRSELSRVEDFLSRLDGITTDTKVECLLETLNIIREHGRDGRGSGKAVIFTESVKTQDYLYEVLTANGYRPEDVTLFRGQNDHARAKGVLRQWENDVSRQLSAASRPNPDIAMRMALVDEFRNRSLFFISTEAGAKGLNLQFCESLINYDLPWNPQRIEQRIGRVHRYGQRRGVTVFNFLDRDNEAQRLTFDILSQKLDLFGRVLDASDVVLHEAGTDCPEPLIAGLGIEFESQLRRIYQNSRSLDDVTEQLRELRDQVEQRRLAFDQQQERAAELISSRLDDSVRQVFSRWKAELPKGLELLDRDMDRLLGAFLEAVGAGFHRKEKAHQIVYQIAPCEVLPSDYRSGCTVVVGHSEDASGPESLYPGHALLNAAVDEARRATAKPLDVRLSTSGEPPACWPRIAGRHGRFVVERVRYQGFEPVDHLVAAAVLEGDCEPLDADTVESLLALQPKDLDESHSDCLPVTDRRASVLIDDLLEEAIEDARLDDQTATMVVEEARFTKKLEQLDRYLHDQVLVLKREHSALFQKLEEEELRKERATSPAVLQKTNRAVRRLEDEIQRLNERISELQRGEDPDYERWRNRLFERRFQRPQVERILDVTFHVSGEPPAGQELLASGQRAGQEGDLS